MFYILSRQKDTTNNDFQVSFSNTTVASNRTYASEAATCNNSVRENPNRNVTENEYSTVKENYVMQGAKINEATPNQDVKQVISAGHDLAKPQIKSDEDFNDYDHLEHLGPNQTLDETHDSNDRYANANAQGFDSYEIYWHAQNGQYFQKTFCTSAENEQSDNTYEHARNIGYDDSDTYDHCGVFVHGGKEQLSDYANAHAQKTAVTEGVYDHVACDEGNDNDMYE